MNPSLKDWRVIALGLAGGLVFAAAEEALDRLSEIQSRFFPFIESIYEWLVPIVVGAVIALIVSLLRQQKALNEQLSTENSRLKAKLITHTFASYILHEIGNPIHNLNAVLEKPEVRLPEEDSEIIRRNMDRLTSTIGRLKKMSVLSEDIDLREAVHLEDWAGDFVARSAAVAMRKANLRYEEEVDPLVVRMHPLLLEQCFTLLFDNAINAAARTPKGGVIHLRAFGCQDRPQFACITLKNSGEPFPPEVIQAAGRYMVKSTQGSGLGLVLVRDILKQIDGELFLANEEGQSKVTLYIPSDSRL